MKKVFAITVNYSREELTKNLIESLEKSDKSDVDLEIVVVDNSPDKHFSSNGKKSIIVIRPGYNTGFSAGNNIGIKEALSRGADYILLINDDAIADRNLVKNLRQVLESKEKIGITSPKIYFAKGHEYHKDRYSKDQLGRVFWFAGGFNDWANAKSIHRGVDEVDTGQYDKAEKIDFATGCCMMIKREALESTGLFDERYFLYYEEYDLCMRFKKAGYEIYYVPDAIVYHENASSSGGAGNVLHDYFLTRNQMLFGMRYAPLKTKIALLRQSLRLLLNGRKYQKRGVIDYYLRRLGKGTYFVDK